jgi:glycosyltransferase involved in cell wall biosynthesis
MTVSGRPRLMHVVAGLGLGGTEMTCLRLARQWHTIFDQMVAPLDPTDGPLLAALQDVPGLVVEVPPVGLERQLELFRWLARTARQRRPDAVVLHLFGLHHLLAGAAARMGGSGAVACKAGNPSPARPAMRWRWRAILAASRLLRIPVAACSQSVHDELLGLGVGLPRHSRPIPNGIDVARAVELAAAERAGTGKKRPVVGMVARLDPIKDHATLLAAFAAIRRRRVDAELWLVGDGPRRAALEAMVGSLGIGADVAFLGTRTDVAELLGELDVCAFSTTRDEGFGIALAEAMAAGLPIVASDVPACREVLAGGEAGILVPPGDAAALAAALDRLLAYPEERAALGARARDRVSREYGIELCAARWERLLFGRPHSSHGPATCAS